MHLEEDTGKNLHVGGATGRIHGADHSLIDYNRAGIPLVEIVTRPIPGAGAKAPEVAKRLRHRAARDPAGARGLRGARWSRATCAATSTSRSRPIGSLEWGTRTETKNVNSLRSVERAVRYEMRRQAAVLDAGGRIVQETRHFHEDTGSTSPGRSKEEATDYRYFPEPDLVPIAPDEEWVEKLAAALPELPAARRARLSEEWGIAPTEMAWLVNAGAVELVSDTVAAGASPADARKWWLGELARRANDAGVELAELAVTPAQVAELVGLVAAGTINDQLARQALDGVLAGEGDPGAGRRGPRPGRHGGVRRAGRRGRRRDRGQPGRRREGPRRQGAGDRRAGRRGHEDHPRQGRRGHRQADARRAARCGLPTEWGPEGSASWARRAQLSRGTAPGRGAVRRTAVSQRGAAGRGRRLDAQDPVVVLGRRRRRRRGWTW